jgi:hypothetical protein
MSHSCLIANGEFGEASAKSKKFSRFQESKHLLAPLGK